MVLERTTRKPVHGAVVRYQPVEPGVEGRWIKAFTDRSGAAILFHTRSALDLRLEAKGFRLETVEGVSNDSEVLLHPQD